MARKRTATDGSPGYIANAAMCNAKAAMRDPEIIETDLMEISAITDDLVKFERIVVWCASHPDEVPFALHQLLRQREREPNANRSPGNWAGSVLKARLGDGNRVVAGSHAVTSQVRPLP